ncbi:hypothetical protein AVV36_gp206 [Pectobacterium bacteriophage PM2]|uniref:Uncharacterized protein n=1 Tax=Pectobacterium bacteriophage PM2 TaxID=1429794 RepID=A0A0A0PZP2_9CAUD|nr:hypothetical protein AVV36_gp206 [Pectobacterium bacteriophage PM2]AHY25204.1 hypothetical protein PM2_242 [Pectobacterium bacteriophage PM2]
MLYRPNQLTVESSVSKDENIRIIIKRFEEAAKYHGATQRSVADANISESSAYASAKVLRDIRKELYEELGL